MAGSADDDVKSLAADLKMAMRGFAQSVVIVSTVGSDGARYAMAATAVTPLSMDPPSMLICVNRTASSHATLESGANFALNILKTSIGFSCTLNFLINAKIGGKAFSQTEAMLDGYGVSKRSGEARDNGGVEINAIKGTTPVTKIDAKLYYTTVGDRNGISEEYVYDRTNIRLTQFALSYDLDVKKLDLPIKAASISAVGQNLFFLYKKAPFDPELTMSTDLNSQSLDNFNVPSTRTFGFNLKITF